MITALNTGMRMREILYLRTTDLDFRNYIINIEDTKNEERGKAPMNEYLKGVLKEHLEGHDFEYVFCDSDSRPFDNVRHSFEVARKKAGIENFRFHDLRHSFASHLALRGVDLYTIQRLGRWKTLSMVQRYAHLSLKHQQTAINALNDLFLGTWWTRRRIRCTGSHGLRIDIIRLFVPEVVIIFIKNGLFAGTFSQTKCNSKKGKAQMV